MNKKLESLFVNDIPLIDVRAPVEFNAGAFPCAINLPILEDAEREEVGITYKQDGPAAAEARGFELVAGYTKESRVAAWRDFYQTHPDSQLYCFRGGKRSEIAVTWLAEVAIQVPRIEGGYKRLRRFLIDSLDRLPDLVTVAGPTGVGKTELLRRLPVMIDLEDRANHRGSAFGRTATPQPSQIDFENQVAIDFLKVAGKAPVYIEDEGRLIGRIHVPVPIQDGINSAPIVFLEEDMAGRTHRIHEDYVEGQWQRYRSQLGEQEAIEPFRDFLLGAVSAIQKRLGGDRYREVRAMMQAALAASDMTARDNHLPWIQYLLENYYDPMYNYQLNKKRDRIVFRGNMEEIIDWARTQRHAAVG